LAIRWQAPQAKGQVLLPGILYHGNPSGAASQRTPVFSPETPLAVFEEHRYWARHACDVMLTYLVIWDIDLPPGRLRNHRFQTRGWTVVSPQNQHIDAYGVLMAPDAYRLGQILDDDRLRQIGLLMFRSCGQLIDPYGSHGEQPQHTNYAQRGRVDDIFALRGGYVEDWTVFWLTAHSLNAAARFKELGVTR
jgi:hypothetical protein